MRLVKLLACFLALGLIAPAAFSQEAIRQITLPSTPTAVSVDKYGHFYYGDAEGNIYQYSLKGEQLNQFSSARSVQISLIEAWQALKVFAMYRDYQEFSLLDRFLAQEKRYSLDNKYQTGFVPVATIGNNDVIWLFDEGTFSIKQFLFDNPTASQTIPLDLVLPRGNYQVNFMKAYKSKLYVSINNNALLIFDNFGNFIREVKLPGIGYFNIYNDYLYYLNNNLVGIYHIFSKASKELNVPKHIKPQFVLLSEKRMIVFSQKQVVISNIDF